jgi:hypothetical protein
LLPYFNLFKKIINRDNISHKKKYQLETSYILRVKKILELFFYFGKIDPIKLMLRHFSIGETIGNPLGTAGKSWEKLGNLGNAGNHGIK